MMLYNILDVLILLNYILLFVGNDSQFVQYLVHVILYINLAKYCKNVIDTKTFLVQSNAKCNIQTRLR